MALGVVSAADRREPNIARRVSFLSDVVGVLHEAEAW